jgi:hypothetical protein
MTDTNNDAPETNAAEEQKKPTPPLPPPPGEEPPPPAQVERAALPDYDPGPSPPKSPPLAAVLSILFPGLGHLYLWAYERAFMIWATIAVCIFMIINGFWPFSFLIAFVYFFSIFDSYREAQFYNMRAESRCRRGRPGRQTGFLRYGLDLRLVASPGLLARRVLHHRRDQRQDERPQPTAGLWRGRRLLISDTPQRENPGASRGLFGSRRLRSRTAITRRARWREAR